MGEAAIRYLKLINEMTSRAEDIGSNPHREAELAGELDRLWSQMTEAEQAQVDRRLQAFPDAGR